MVLRLVRGHPGFVDRYDRGPHELEATRHPQCDHVRKFVVRTGAAPNLGMVQKRPFSGVTRDFSAALIGPALERVYASPWLPCWGCSSPIWQLLPGVEPSRNRHSCLTPRSSRDPAKVLLL